MRLRQNGDRRSGKVRKHINRRADRNDPSIDEQDCSGDQHDQAVPDGPLNNLVQHASALDLVRVRPCIGGPQLLKFELVRALSHNALTRLYAGDNRNLAAVLVSKGNLPPFELFARQQDVNDLLAFVVENRFSGNKKYGDRSAPFKRATHEHARRAL